MRVRSAGLVDQRFRLPFWGQGSGGLRACARTGALRRAISAACRGRTTSPMARTDYSTSAGLSDICALADRPSVAPEGLAPLQPAPRDLVARDAFPACAFPRLSSLRGSS